MAADGRSVLAEALSGDWTDELVFAGPASAQYDETSDGAHFLWMQDADQGEVRVAWDGRPSEPFELIPQASGEPFAWSAGKLRVAWYGRRLGRFFVTVDGIEHPWEGITRSVPPTFSAGGGRVAYGVYVDGIARLVVDGHVFGDWRPAPVAPVFSPDGGRFAFVAENLRSSPAASAGATTGNGLFSTASTSPMPMGSRPMRPDSSSARTVDASSTDGSRASWSGSWSTGQRVTRTRRSRSRPSARTAVGSCTRRGRMIAWS